MRANIMGIIFSGSHDKELEGLTGPRTMGSIPFGGRYRMIDFPLSNMVNSGIGRVAIIAKSNYQSLMGHLESGKTWDLARRHGGLVLFPPFGTGNLATHKTRSESLYGIKDYILHCKEKYVVVSDCDLVSNLNISDMLQYHIKSKASVTFGVMKRTEPIKNGEYMFFKCDKGRVVKLSISPSKIDDDMYFCPGIFIMERQNLIDLVCEEIENNNSNLYRDVFGTNVENLKMMTYLIPKPAFFIGSIADYGKASFALLDRDVRAKLFDLNNPIYTKIYDEMPVKYGLGSDVKNCLIADGCEIEGEIENSILFRGVKVGRGAKVKNCILMESTVVSDNCNIEYVLSDKSVKISEGTELKGAENNPFFMMINSKV